MGVCPLPPPKTKSKGIKLLIRHRLFDVVPNTITMKFALIIQQHLWSEIKIALKFRPAVLPTLTVYDKKHG